VYGVLGLGIPGRPASIRARALGSGLDAVDATGAVNPAATALQQRLAVSGYVVTSGRRYEAGTVNRGDLRDTRFPFVLIAGPIPGAPVAFALSYAAYTDRSYDLTSSDTVTLRGTPVTATDRIRSDGGLVDVRGAIGWNVTTRLQLGLGVHLISGSTRESRSRQFDDPNYGPVSQRGDVSYSGWGVSVGALLTPASWLRLGVSGRRDSRVEVTGPLLPVVETQLPTTLTAGFTVAPLRSLRWSTSISWRSWSDARDDIPDSFNLSVFDTWEFGSGVELGGPDIGVSRIPLRVGVRYAQLPFSPTADQPTEVNISVGSGLAFAGNRAMFEFSVERVRRDGGGALERAWHILFGLTLRP
jgi:hypothetical protein